MNSILPESRAYALNQFAVTTLGWDNFQNTFKNKKEGLMFKISKVLQKC